jgi:serine/threonine-protein kinase
MAQVWAARMKGARQFQKLVAVKTMLPKLSEDEQFEQMFLDEASLASQIRHPNAVEIMDLGEQHGILYLVMEMIEGVPLNHLMKAAKPQGGIPIPVAARIALQACAGLHAAHELKDEKGRRVGLVHRDVSPQNILVTYDGVTKVVDFGVAKATALGGGATQAGQVKGKVSYMAPEQVSGVGLDRRADVFALGIVLYALTTGKHPFRRDSEAATMYNICSPDPVVPPSGVIEGFPKALEKIVLKALAKDRDDRFASCDEMLRALDSLPTELRVSSNSDVGDFVQQLMGERRKEQRKRIDIAIARADANPTGTGSGIDLVGNRAGHSENQELSGLGSGMHPHATRNRIMGMAGLAALVFSGGVLVTTFFARDDPTPAIREIDAPEPPSQEMRPPEETAPIDELGPGTEIDPDQLPGVDEVKSKEPKGTTRPKTSGEVTSPAHQQRPAPPQRPAPSQNPAKENPNSWKYDAGF